MDSGFTNGEPRPRSNAVGAKIETPLVLRGGVWEGVFPFPLGGAWGGAMHLPRKFFDFGSPNYDFRCILGTIFTVTVFFIK